MWQLAFDKDDQMKLWQEQFMFFVSLSDTNCFVCSTTATIAMQIATETETDHSTARKPLSRTDKELELMDTPIMTQKLVLIQTINRGI